MILTVDAGNTNIAMGLFRGRTLVSHWRLSSRTHRTADEFFLHLTDILTIERVDAGQIASAVVCSVVPALTSIVHDGLARLLDRDPVVVSHRIPLPVAFAIHNPAEIGGDLIANAVGGYRQTGGACVIVDFGTALSFTAVDRAGAIQGVAIAPGVNTAVQGLISRTAALPMVDLTWPEGYIGRDTGASLRSGILNGYSGLVDRVAGGMAEELADRVTVLATGGEAHLVAEHCRSVDRSEPWLTLQGLREIGDFQST